MTAVIQANNLSKSFGSFKALDGANFEVPLGRIVGVVGANGAGKTTMLNAILGLTKYDGELSVLGLSPASDRDKIMEDVSFISDVATLPRWMKVCEVLDYVEAVHPKFSRESAMGYLAKTKIPMKKRVKALSKGMVTQLHLAVVMSIEAKLLVLDEPTLGLDILFRKNFYSTLLEDYFDHDRTILITTHQVEEIEHILTDAMFIRDGKMVLHEDMDTLSEMFFEVVVEDDNVEAARALGPVAERSSLGRTVFAFEGVEKAKLKAVGEVHTMKLADIFVVKMTGGKQ